MKQDILDSIYEAYPKHKAPRVAKVAIEKALKRLIEGEYKKQPLTEEMAISGLLLRTEMFANSAAGKKGKYTPYPATWFNAGGYLEDPMEWRDDEEEITALDTKQLTNQRRNEQLIRDAFGAGCPAETGNRSLQGEPIARNDKILGEISRSAFAGKP